MNPIDLKYREIVEFLTPDEKELKFIELTPDRQYEVITAIYHTFIKFDYSKEELLELSFKTLILMLERDNKKRLDLSVEFNGTFDGFSKEFFDLSIFKGTYSEQYHPTDKYSFQETGTEKKTSLITDKESVLKMFNQIHNPKESGYDTASVLSLLLFTFDFMSFDHSYFLTKKLKPKNNLNEEIFILNIGYNQELKKENNNSKQLKPRS